MNLKLQSCKFLTNSRFGFCSCRSSSQFSVRNQERTNSSVRTNVSTLITLNTIIHLPFRNINSDSAFFELRSSGRESSVFTSSKCTNRKIIPFLCVHHVNHITDKFRTVFVTNTYFVFQVCPFSRNSNFHYVFSQTTRINSSIVHLHNSLTLLSV